MGSQKELAEILEQMAAITRMRRGKLTEQYNRKKNEDGSEQKWGPYYTLQAWTEGKNRSERVRREDAPVVREDIQRHERFCELCESYVRVAERSAKKALSQSKKKPRKSKRRSAEKSTTS